MNKLLKEWWLQLWPNLISQILWTTPMFIWHHSRLKKHIDRMLK